MKGRPRSHLEPEILAMRANGATPAQIAKRLDRKVPWICQVLRRQRRWDHSISELSTDRQQKLVFLASASGVTPGQMARALLNDALDEAQ